MRVRVLVAALALPLGLMACATERDVVVDADRSPATSFDVAGVRDELVLHPGPPCTGWRGEQALCGSADGGLAQPPVPRRDVPRVLDDQVGGDLDSP